MRQAGIRIGLVQFNPIVGDISCNTDAIISTVLEARDENKCDIVVFPELAICGYPPDDLLLRPGFQKSVQQSISKINQHVKNVITVFGSPVQIKNELYNSAVLLGHQEEPEYYYKIFLPNYGVFDEKRYFHPGGQVPVFNLCGIPTALSVCEDIWSRTVCEQAANAGAKFMININASPYHIDKISLRKQILKQRVTESGLNILYINMVGGQDELVFDGGSMAIDNQGEVIFQAPQFEQGIYVVELSNKNTGKITVAEKKQATSIVTEEGIYQALVLGVRDYVRKNGFHGAVIGLSGGIDSALTLCIAVDALGKENIEVVMMPSRFTSSMSLEDSKFMVDSLGITSHIISIEKPFQSFAEILHPVFKNLPPDTTEENIQARCRGILLMAISNKTGKLVLTTGNKSEMSVGYATLYGDMAGGFAPLKDVYKTLVYKLSNWRNKKSPLIPQRIIDRPPTAELRENQLDQDSLPPYEILDAVLERYIELDQSPEQIIKSGFDNETVIKIVTMVDKNEYKRRQAAPGVKITQRAFGRDRRYPITSGYREI